MKFLISLFLLVSSLSAFGKNPSLEELLHLDRFQFYVVSWAETMHKRGQVEAADVMRGLKPAELLELTADRKLLTDAKKYDDLIISIIKKKKPNLKIDPKELRWEYNFLKNKLNEAFTVNEVRASSVTLAEALPTKSLTLEPRDMSEVLLDVDSYVSDRTTRAVFWEASLSKREIELHVGSAGSFREHLNATGGKILGEVSAKARNYNPIYIVQYPGEKEVRYAVTEIAGADRLKHLQEQSAMVRWQNTNGRLAPPPPIAVVGDAAAKLASEEANLTRVLKTIGPSDVTIIGQKGAFERTFLTLSQIEALQSLKTKNPSAFAKLAPADQRLIERVLTSDDLTTMAMKEASKIGDIHKSLTPELARAKIEPVKFTSFNYDRGSYSFSDFSLLDKDGKVRRVRVFSNVWGDEVVPIANSLRETGVKTVSYIGTAGALPGSGLQVGDLAIPRIAIDQNGKSFDVPGHDLTSSRLSSSFSTVEVSPKFSKVEGVVNVATPLDETPSWLKSLNGKAQVVEVETAYLARAFQGKGFHVKPYLLISDVVGSEGETLGSASSSARRRAQIDAITDVLKTNNLVMPTPVAATSGIAAWVDELVPSRDEVAKFYITQRAISENRNTKAGVKKLIDETKSFTTARLISSINEADELVWLLDEVLEERGVRPKFAITEDFAKGLFNPAMEKPVFALQVRTKAEEKLVQDLITELGAKDPKILSRLNLQVHRGTLPEGLIKIGDIPNEGIFNRVYQNASLTRGGMAVAETASGVTKFVKVTSPSEASSFSDIAYFTPDDQTAQLLKQLDGQGDAAKILKAEVATMNAFAGPNKPWEIVVTTVDKLPDGRLAQIVPEVAGKADNLTIHLRITKDGLRNPAVVLEELIHLQQITGAPVPWRKNTQLKSFVNPVHWTEVVINAQAGSALSVEKLARLELEAAQVAEEAIKHYQKAGLFKADKALVNEYLEARLTHTEKLYTDTAKLARAERKTRAAGWERAKKVFDSLEKQTDKLNDLIAKGDRKGVKKLIEAYLPWDLMEPTEKKLWGEWLEAIEKPNRKNVELVFRGMYDDTILRARDGKPYLMSTMLTRNQGSYTRRLRSLATMREKFASQALRDSYSAFNLSGAKNPGTVSVMMANHAIEAKGSPFLSTASYDVATKFGPRQIGAFHLEPRRFLLNGLAPDKYLYQKEKLTPLIIFPDEVVYFHDYASNPVEGVGPRDPKNRKKHFIGEVENVLGRKVTAAEISGVGDDKQFMKESFERLKETLLTPEGLPKPAGGVCTIGGKSCDCLFGGLNALLK